MSKPTSPNYIDDGVGLPVPRGPYMSRSARIAALVLEADRTQLEVFCDTYLNVPMGGHIRYRPLLGRILLTFTDLQGDLLDHQERNIGRVREAEVTFWVPVVAMKQAIGGLYVPTGLAMFVPYLFVDNSFALVAGREVQGFFKSIGYFQHLPDVRNPEFSLDTLAFKTFGPDQEGGIQRLMRVERIQGQPAVAQTQLWSGGEEAFREIVHLLTENQSGDVTHSWLDETLNLFVHVTKPEVPVVFLKQFRSVEDTTKACYQAVVEAPGRVTDFHHGGLLQGEYRLILEDLQSHPIAQRLGLPLQAGKMEPLRGFWVDIGFVFDNGTEVWKAS
jgi:hypothetical protein